MNWFKLTFIPILALLLVGEAHAQEVHIYDPRVQSKHAKKITDLFERVQHEFALPSFDQSYSLSLIYSQDWDGLATPLPDQPRNFSSYEAERRRLGLMVVYSEYDPMTNEMASANPLGSSVVQVHEFGHLLFNDAVKKVSLVKRTRAVDVAVDEVFADFTAILFYRKGSVTFDAMEPFYQNANEYLKTFRDPGAMNSRFSGSSRLRLAIARRDSYLKRDYTRLQEAEHQQVNADGVDPHFLLTPAMSQFWVETIQPCLKRSPKLKAQIFQKATQASVQFAMTLSSKSGPFYEDEINLDYLTILNESMVGVCQE